VQVLRNSKKQLPSKRSFWQCDLFVGPLIGVPGAYIVAVDTRNKIKMAVSTVIKGINNVEELNLYQLTNNTDYAIKLFQLTFSADQESTEVGSVNDKPTESIYN
jgi:hypothetical protein